MTDTPRDPEQDAFAQAANARKAQQDAKKRAAELAAIQAEYQTQSSEKTQLDRLRERIFETSVEAIDCLEDLMRHAESTAVRRDAAKALLSHGVAMAKISDTQDSIEEILRAANREAPSQPMEDLDTP